tara:strand:- start:6164 stop:8155 length:1992 start_codon:yes stop_codon:yes gene_type:complete
MATNEVEIEVVLEGAQKAAKELKGLGEAGRSVAESMRTTNEKLGEGFTSVTNGVDSLVESMEGLSAAVVKSSAESAIGIRSFLGPVALLTIGFVELYEGIKKFSGSAQEAEQRAQAMAAAAADLQSKLESLSERGVIPSTRELIKFTKANLQAQIQKELLQIQIEKSRKVFERLADAEKEANTATRARIKAQKDSTVSQGVVNKLTIDELNAKGRLESANNKLKFTLQGIVRVQELVNQKVRDTQKIYESFEEQTKDSLLSRAKEKLQRLESIKLLRLEAKGIEDRSGALKEEIKIGTQGIQAIIQDYDVTENVKGLKDLNNSLDQTIKLLIKNAGASTESELVTLAGLKRVAKLREDSRKKQSAEDKKQFSTRLKLEKQQDREEITRLARIDALKIRLESDGFKQRENLALLAYNTELQLAEDNADKKIEAELRYQLAVKQIEESRLKDQQSRFNQEQKMIDDFLDKARKAQEEANRREREAQQEKINQAKADYNELINAVDHYSSGLANAAAGALLFGDSVSQGVADALNALASEAAVNALIETAKGISAAVLTPKLAGAHFAAAGQFAVAATAARGASALLGGGGGGGVTSGASSSPSGAPQTASAPIREEARESQIVYNINFGSSVIYDSKRAAEQALADRITTIQNTRRRGAPIPRRA